MAQQISVDPAARTGESAEGGTVAIAGDLAYERLLLVNVVFHGRPGAGPGGWVLVDTGIPGMAERIVAAAAARFGPDAPPSCIIMTHGHFDHVGTLPHLLERWDVPVYAHSLECPYLDGRAAYVPPDPQVGGGLMSLLAPLYPRDPVDVGRWLRALPEDGTVPGMPGWGWVHTPGHAPGHVSLWREADRALIAGDAFITTRQESAYAVAVQAPELHGPPMYFTPDWPEAASSVRRLAALEPELVVTGHGPALRGAEMRRALGELARNFEAVAVPRHGRYVDHPMTESRLDDAGLRDAG